MDEFARLRHRIYLERTGNRCEDNRNLVEHLSRAVLGDACDEPVTRDIVAAAKLRHTDRPDAIAELIPRLGVSPYFDKFLGDALSSHPHLLDDPEFEGVKPVMTPSPENAGNTRDAARARSRRAGPGPAVSSRDLPKMDTVPSDDIDHPVSIVQCMFYGDPARSGRGSSGGIGTLLQQLGSAMAVESDGVATLVLYNPCTASYPLKEIEHVSRKHSIVRVPLCLTEEPPAGFLIDRRVFREAIRAALARFGLEPEVFHVRFLDDASLQVARETRLHAGRLVTTVTPDPHRLLCDEDGNLRSFPVEVGLEYLNKILIGDELVELSHGLLAIGAQTIESELLSYYPQLEDTRGRVIQGIDEGVRVTIDGGVADPGELLTTGDGRRIDPANLSRPAILCVGRLARIKNQVALVEAWTRGACLSHNLVLIGGDLDSPTAEESDILGRINTILSSRPDLEGRFCHLPGSPNEIVRSIQKHLATRVPEGGFDIYVCPSLKEEFGLSILEAMASGMIVCAPLRGGARTYLRHRINGYLVDTRNAQTLARELSETVFSPEVSGEDVDAMRASARETVRRRYSVERIASEFAGFYRRVTRA